MESVQQIMTINSKWIMEQKMKWSKKLNENMELTSQSINCLKCEDKEYLFDINGAVKWCECRDRRIAKERIEKSDLANRFDTNRFSTYKINNAQRQMAVKMCEHYITNFDENKNLILSGQVGSGKTHLAIATTRVLLETIGVKYTDFVNEIARLKFNQLDQEEYTKSVDSYKNATVLFIDDLYKGDISPATQRIVQDIVNYRYNNNKAMIITTELNKNRLLDVNEATGSRLIEMCSHDEGEYFFEFSGRELNYRLFK
jgi:DNA replication protein DnaC